MSAPAAAQQLAGASAAELAATANREHALVKQFHRGMRLHAENAGEACEAAKARLGYRDYGAWVREDCDFSERTARVYRQIWRNRQSSAASEHESIQAALGALASDRPETGRPGSLRGEFIEPPFSVLDRRSGDWQKRRRAWLDLGIRPERGRAENLLGLSDSIRNRSGADSGTSVFDPVLCELAYRWWCPPGGRILDPFAGGSVRGIVAAKLGYSYLGIDLRPEQIAANLEQAEALHLGPRWIVGDSADLAFHLADEPPPDLLFSSPPFGDLEVYSDDPRDLSVMAARAWLDFCAALADVIGQAVEALAGDSFAAIVIADIRDQRGHLRRLPEVATNAFVDAGAALYNDASVIDPAGSAAMRASRNFAHRKLTPVHQRLLVFVKGDAERAADRCKGAG